jgi:hypothetical protein
MKNLKSIVLGLALLLICGAVNANPINENDNLTATHAINTYVTPLPAANWVDLTTFLTSR